MTTTSHQHRFTPLAPTPRVEDLQSLENSIICGDCKDRMFEHIPDDSIDLIYMDPPFFSGTQYDLIWGEDSKATIQSFEDAAFYKKVCGKCNADWGKDTKGNDLDLCDNYKCDGVLKDAKDVRRNDIETYLGWLKDRLSECYRVLKPTGSMYVHLDHHAVFNVKVMLDEIFKTGIFKTMITWRRCGSKGNSNTFANNSDYILYYVKSKEFAFNMQYGGYSEATLKMFKYNDHDERGFYKLTDISSPGGGGYSYSLEHGEKMPKGGYRWKEDTMLKKISDRRVVVKTGKVPAQKRYLSESSGVPFDNVWVDIENVKSPLYPTQKPEPLLERIIKASSNLGDIVLDPFCGCGTTITVAQRLDRRWIGIDIEPISCTAQQARMERTYGKEFPIIDLGKQITEAEAKQATIDARKMNPFAFQKWAVTLLGGEPNSRVVGDDGIDGWIVDPFADLVHGDLIQVKRSDNVGKDVIKLHAYNIQKYGVTGGLVIGFGFTSGSHDEVKAIRETGINIELLTVKSMMMQYGKNVKSCGKQSTSKQAIL